MPKRNPITQSQIEEVIEKFDYVEDACNHLNITRSVLNYLFKKYNFASPKGYFSRKVMSEEYRQEVSKRVSGEGNPFYGKKHSEKTRLRMSENHADFTGDNNPFKKSLESNPEKREELRNRAIGYWANLTTEQKYDHNKSCLIGDMSTYFWKRIISNAKQKNREFVITPEYAWQLFLDQEKKCALSGILLNLKTIYDVTASLDRIDSTKGYVEGNVQWVHKEINMMKNNMTDEDFIKFCTCVAAKNI